jgi:hypothetical protein
MTMLHRWTVVGVVLLAIGGGQQAPVPDDAGDGAASARQGSITISVTISPLDTGCRGRGSEASAGRAAEARPEKNGCPAPHPCVPGPWFTLDEPLRCGLGPPVDPGGPQGPKAPQGPKGPKGR